MPPRKKPEVGEEEPLPEAINLDVLMRSLIIDNYDLVTYKRLKGYNDLRDEEVADCKAKIDLANIISAYTKPLVTTALSLTPITPITTSHQTPPSSLPVKRTVNNNHDDDDDDDSDNDKVHRLSFDGRKRKNGGSSLNDGTVKKPKLHTSGHTTDNEDVANKTTDTTLNKSSVSGPARTEVRNATVVDAETSGSEQ